MTATRVLGDDDVRRARVAAQLLHRPGRARPAVADIVSWLLATQAQDIGAGPLAIRARSRGLTAADVVAARHDQSVVRAWGPRGTLHLMSTEDVGWLTSAVRPPLLATAARRLAQEGVHGTPDQLLATVERALAGHGPVTKQQLADRLARLGCRVKGQGIVYLAFLAGLHGKAVLGPDRNNRATYVYAADWLGREMVLEPDRDNALAELARRYLRAHGPATPEDLAAWSGLPLRDGRAAWAAITGELTEVEHRGRPLWQLRNGQIRGWQVGRGRARPPAVVALLPAFDEYLLGWRDRTLILDPVHARLVQPGGGTIRPSVMADGRIVGTWRTDSGSVAVDLFADADSAALAAESDDVVRFGGRTR